HQQGKVKSERGDYAAFFENVYGSIRSNEPLMVTPEQARDTIKIIELAMISNSEGRICKVG
ncbi:MAG: hypothetical protein WBB36_03290, partial [Chitinophagales bacterium]